MSAPWKIELDGRVYTSAELAKMAGVCRRTITDRAKKHPEWGLAELIQPNMNPDGVWLEHGGRRMKLEEWAEEKGVSYSVVHERWKNGVRRFDRLFLPYHALRKTAPRFFLSEEAKEWLRETKFARSGMADEWEIACDLVGISRACAGTLKGMLT